MKAKNWMLNGASERYRLQLREVTPDSSPRPLWDRSGAGRKFVLRGAILAQLGCAGRTSGAKH